jgi:hypothetical protein
MLYSSTTGMLEIYEILYGKNDFWEAANKKLVDFT